MGLEFGWTVYMPSVAHQVIHLDLNGRPKISRPMIPRPSSSIAVLDFSSVVSTRWGRGVEHVVAELLKETRWPKLLIATACIVKLYCSFRGTDRGTLPPSPWR